MTTHKDNVTDVVTSEHNNTMEDSGDGKKLVRVWMDGSFDMLHMGHVAAMHKARCLGDCLVVGAQSDADVTAHKGPPVHPQEERFRLIQAVKFVDEFAGAAKYGTSVDTLEKHNCDFCVHGDDATLRASDTDVVKQLIKMNRARLVSRGFGLSTTKQIELVLQRSDKIEHGNQTTNTETKISPSFTDAIPCAVTASQIHAFMNEIASKPRGKVVYVDGAFDLFNVGHLSFLEKAAQQGDFLLIGIHSDAIVARRKGPIHPVLTMNERALLVLSLKCVSDVIFDAPETLTADFLDTFKIDVVCRGQMTCGEGMDDTDRYTVVKQRGIFKVIHSGSEVTSQTIVDRIVCRRNEYVVRNKKKLQDEARAEMALKEIMM